MQQIRQDIKSKSNQKACLINDFDCTLLVIIKTSDFLAAMQIGDGLIVVKNKDESEYQLLFMPYKGEFCNQTVFVTSSNASSEMKVHFQSKPVDFICIATDGIERICLDQSQPNHWKAYQELFHPLYDE